MYNYAKHYRNWAPQRRPHATYRQHTYFPIQDSQEDGGNYADSNYHDGDESRPFENEIRTIDYYAQRNGNYDGHEVSKSSTWHQGSQHDDVNKNAFLSDNPSGWSHNQGYSTLPEFTNTHTSSGSHKLRSAAGQRFPLKNQNFEDGQEFRLNNQNPVGNKEFRFNNQNFQDGQEFRFNNENSAKRQEFRFKNQNFGADQEFRLKNYNSGHGQESRLSVQNYPFLQNTQLNSHKFGSGPTSAVTHDSRHNSQNFGGTHELQFNTHTQNSDQKSRLKDQNFGGVQNLWYNTQNSAERYKNQNSGSGGRDTEPSFSTSNGNSNTNRPHTGTEQNQNGADNSHPNPNSDDLYYKAFRSFSFRRNPTQSSTKAGQYNSFSGEDAFNTGVVPQSSSHKHHSSVTHNTGQNKWYNDGTGQNKDHDIGFFEGLEDINDKAGV